MGNAEFNGLPNENKLVHLVRYKLKRLSMFVEKGMDQRTEILYWGWVDNVYIDIFMLYL